MQTHKHTHSLDIRDCSGDAAVVVTAESLTVLATPCRWLSYHLSGKTGVTKSHP